VIQQFCFCLCAPEKLTAEMGSNTCQPVFIEAFFIVVQRWKQAVVSPSVDNQNVVLHIIGYHTALKTKRIPGCSATLDEP
jgi:hypothetical protein